MGTDFHEMPVALRGVVAIPAGRGPFPVAVVVHGSYPFCTAEGEIDTYPCPAENDLRQAELRLEQLQEPADETEIAAAEVAVENAEAAYAESLKNLSLTENSEAMILVCMIHRMLRHLKPAELATGWEM